MSNIKFLFLLAILFISCVSNKETVKTFQTNKSVILRYNSKYNCFYRINIPVGLNLINNSPIKKPFLTIKYEYIPYSKGLGEDLYSYNSTDLKKIKNNKKKYIEPFKERNILLYSWYKLDSLSFTQKHFKPYIEKMLQEKKDTLHIGTVSKFRKKHKELFEKLTKNDSISIQFLNNGKLGERITVPVKW